MNHSSSRSNTIVGIGIVLLSAVCLALQNVVLRLFFSANEVLGLFTFGGFVEPLLSNIIFLLALRLTGMAVMLGAIASSLYPKTLQAIRVLPETPRLLRATLASGVCLFGGLTCLYLALSQVATGIAIATFFVYPALTVLLAWRIFRQRPQPYKLGLMTVIFAGVVILNWIPVIPGSAAGSGNPVLGILSALGASLGFGIYGILSEIALRPQSHQPHLHPIPFSLLVFTIVAILASLTVVGLQLGLQPLTIGADILVTIVVMTLFSAILTLIAYVLNNFGVRYIGAALTALITAMVPSLTTIFAWIFLQESLQPHQIGGIVIVTLGVATLSIKVQQ